MDLNFELTLVLESFLKWELPKSKLSHVQPDMIAKDPIQLLEGPIIRRRDKNFKEALHSFIKRASTHKEIERANNRTNHKEFQENIYTI